MEHAGQGILDSAGDTAAEDGAAQQPEHGQPGVDSYQVDRRRHHPRGPRAASRVPARSRSSAGPSSGATTANGAIVISRYNATLSLLSPVAAAKNRVLASATAIAASVAKLATTGQVSAVSPDLSAPSAVAARCTNPHIRDPISRLRCAAARVTGPRSPPVFARGGSR